MYAFSIGRRIPHPAEAPLLFQCCKKSLDFENQFAHHYHFIFAGNGILCFMCGIMTSVGGILPAPNFYNGILNLPELTIYY